MISRAAVLSTQRNDAKSNDAYEHDTTTRYMSRRVEITHEIRAFAFAFD